MENNALITMSGRQEVDGELDRYELTTLGSYVRKGDKILCVLYRAVKSPDMKIQGQP